MTLKEAIEKAGEGGKVGMRSFKPCFGLTVVRDGLRYDDPESPLKGTIAKLTTRELTATDWELVEPEIGVGDYVRYINAQDSHEGKVIAIDGALAWIQYYDNTVEDYRLVNLTLIRKAPEKHVIEGVIWGDSGTIHPTGINIRSKLKPFCNNGKKYRLIVEPMED